MTERPQCEQRERREPHQSELTQGVRIRRARETEIQRESGGTA